MKQRSFAKTLSANDLGITGSHQAGIHVPKSEPELLSFFPKLDTSVLNPDAWIVCVDDSGEEWKLRFIYYNNRLHTDSGTRNEYRLTYLTPFFRRTSPKPGDQLVFTATSVQGRYRIAVRSVDSNQAEDETGAGVIALRGWRRVH
jgi:hypothetical protein